MSKLIPFAAGVFIFLCSCLVSCSPRAVGIVAHRGYWNSLEGGYSHNSLAALRAAGGKGYWGSEFDVNMTADGSLLVFHDSKIDGKRICDYSSEELSGYRLPNGEGIPTLDEFLSVAAEYPNTMLVLELKKHHTPEMERAAADKCIASLKSHGLYSPERVMFISFSEYACRYFAENAHGFIVQYLDGDKSVKELAAEDINGIDLHYRKLLGDKKWIEEARRHGFSINAWTVNNEDDIHDIIDAGVDFITTDEPEKVREMLGKKELRHCPSLQTSMRLESVLKEGDILFTTAKVSPMSSAISASTSHTGSSAAKSFDHCAIFHKGNKDEGYVIEASPSGGVRMVSLGEFISEALDGNSAATGEYTATGNADKDGDVGRYGKMQGVVVMRVSAKGFDVKRSIKAAMSHIGEEYDWEYLPDNGKSYCSELIQESYQDRNGKLIFEPAPMNFLDSEGNLPDFWKQLFSRNNGSDNGRNDLGNGNTGKNNYAGSEDNETDDYNIPQGVPGTNPNMLAANPKLIDIIRD